MLTAANRVNKLSFDVEKKWKVKNPLSHLENKYPLDQTRNDVFKDCLNLELLAHEVIGPEHSSHKILSYHVDKLRDVRAVQRPIPRLNRSAYVRTGVPKVRGQRNYYC